MERAILSGIKTMIRFFVILCVMGSLSAASSGDFVAEDGTIPVPDSTVSLSVGTKVVDALLPHLDSPDILPVVIYLANQPMLEILQEVQARYRADLQNKSEQMRQINRRYSTGIRPSTPEEARRLAAAEQESMSPQDRRRMDAINKQTKSLLDQMRSEMMARARAAVEPEQDEIRNLIESLGGFVTYQYEIENAIAAGVPGVAIQTIANHPMVWYVDEDTIFHASLDVSAPTAGAPSFWNAGYTSQNYYIAIVDSGVRTSHSALSDRTWTSKTFHNTASNPLYVWIPYNDNPNTTNDLQGHGTAVAGPALSRHTTYRGVAWNSSLATNLKAGFRTTDGGGSTIQSDVMEAVHWGIHNSLIDVLNYS